jgi:hypothetical protein
MIAAESRTPPPPPPPPLLPQPPVPAWPPLLPPPPHALLPLLLLVMLAASSSSSPSSYRKSEGSMPAGAKSSPRSTPRYSTKLCAILSVRWHKDRGIRVNSGTKRKIRREYSPNLLDLSIAFEQHCQWL